MAASQIVTLGLGTPADIAHYVLVGLSPTGPIAIQEAEGDVIRLPDERSVIALPAEPTVIRFPDDATVIRLPVRRVL